MQEKQLPGNNTALRTNVSGNRLVVNDPRQAMCAHPERELQMLLFAQKANGYRLPSAEDLSHSLASNPDLQECQKILAS